jgi:hypothetical protein
VDATLAGTLTPAQAAPNTVEYWEQRVVSDGAADAVAAARPTLVIHGDGDWQVAPSDADVFEAAFEGTGIDFEVQRFADLGHFQTHNAPGYVGFGEEYGLPVAFDAVVENAIIAWVASHALRQSTQSTASAQARASMTGDTETLDLPGDHTRQASCGCGLAALGARGGEPLLGIRAAHAGGWHGHRLPACIAQGAISSNTCCDPDAKRVVARDLGIQRHHRSGVRIEGSAAAHGDLLHVGNALFKPSSRASMRSQRRFAAWLRAVVARRRSTRPSPISPSSPKPISVLLLGETGTGKGLREQFMP